MLDSPGRDSSTVDGLLGTTGGTRGPGGTGNGGKKETDGTGANGTCGTVAGYTGGAGVRAGGCSMIMSATSCAKPVLDNGGRFSVSIGLVVSNCPRK